MPGTRGNSVFGLPEKMARLGEAGRIEMEET